MAKIVIENLYGKILLVQDAKKTLLQHFHDHHIDWMHACGGKGRCTTCKVVVRSGMDKLDLLTPAEARYRSLNALTNEERLACQIKVLHDIEVAAPEEYKLPHVRYSS